MKTLLALALCVLLTVPAGARIGESMYELKLRYGRPLDVVGTKETEIDHANFQRDNYYIEVKLRDGRSVSESITKRDRRDFTMQEVQDLLVDAGFPGAAWRQVNSMTWTQRDRTAVWSSKTFTVSSHARD
jgi:hypothetical protein